MSVRAYRVKRIVKEKRPTFNLWQDTELMGILRNIGKWMFDETGGGFYEVCSEDLEEYLLDNTTTKEMLSPETKRTIKKMLRQAKTDGGFVLYECF